MISITFIKIIQNLELTNESSRIGHMLTITSSQHYLYRVDCSSSSETKNSRILMQVTLQQQNGLLANLQKH